MHYYPVYVCLYHMHYYPVYALTSCTEHISYDDNGKVLQRTYTYITKLENKLTLASLYYPVYALTSCTEHISYDDNGKVLQRTYTYITKLENKLTLASLGSG